MSLRHVALLQPASDTVPKGLGCATKPGKSWLFSSFNKNAGMHFLPLLHPMALLTGCNGSYLEGLGMG